MGFEVTFLYHDKVDGKYNTNDTKELKKKIGRPVDDTPLEKVASVIMQQLARRDIWVVDVEVYEFSRRKIAFKESTNGGGIILKGRKFGIGGCHVGEIEEEACEPSTQPTSDELALMPTTQPQPIINQSAITQPPAPNVNLAPIKRSPEMIVKFDPELVLLAEAAKRNLRFTQDKNYPVIKSEQVGTFPAIYTAYRIKDDLGREVLVHSKYFTTARQVKLVGDDEVEGGFSSDRQKDAPTLAFENQYIDDVPHIRQNLSTSDMIDDVPDLRPSLPPSHKAGATRQPALGDNDFSDGMSMPVLRQRKKHV